MSAPAQTVSSGPTRQDTPHPEAADTATDTKAPAAKETDAPQQAPPASMAEQSSDDAAWLKEVPSIVFD